MKTLPMNAGERKGLTTKSSTQDYEAKYWGTFRGQRPFQRSDGSTGKDKTVGFHSRPGKKQAIRNANRSLNKRARQLLKRQMLSEVND